MTATLLWGGCISCPQFFMFGSPAAKSKCCKKAGKCERSQPNQNAADVKECKRMPLEPQGSLQLDGALAVAELPPGIGRFPRPLAIAPTPPDLRLHALDHSPPDFQSLHATFLI